MWRYAACRAGDAPHTASDPGGSHGNRPDVPRLSAVPLRSVGARPRVHGEHQARNGKPGAQLQARGTEIVASLLADNGSRSRGVRQRRQPGQAWRVGSQQGARRHGRGIPRCVCGQARSYRALGARWSWVDGDIEMARERAAALARQDGIRLVEDSLDIETCEGARTIGLDWVDRHTKVRRRRDCSWRRGAGDRSFFWVT